MSYKHYGRLIGKISDGLEALTGTSPANTTTPFNEQSPGTKFMAYGEDATSLAFNRALGALATNIDSISSLLGSPALRSEMLRPGAHDAPGFTVLQVEDTASTSISLGEGTGQNTQPPVWVYVGFTPESLDRNLKLFHVDGRDAAGVYDNRANLDQRSTFTNYNISPSDCSETTGGPSYFLKPDGSPQDFIGNSVFMMPAFIPPIRRIASDILPYSGVQQLQTVDSWASDGLYLRTETVGELCLRPGCFVEVQNHGAPAGEQGNNGLFRIEAIAHNSDTGLGSVGSKLVLTRGNLHRVTLDSVTGFETAGQLVSWQTRPNHDADSSLNPALRTNFAHVMYVVRRPDISPDAGDLYLASVGGPDNFTYTGGSKITTGATLIESVTTYGSLGLADQEDDAGENWSMPIGTLLYNAESQINPLAAQYGTVTHAIPAGYPVVFSTINTPGQFFPCTPPGFLLNPSLTFDSPVLPGNNYLWAKTLTTVGEQMRAPDGYLSTNAEDASSEPYQTRQDVIATEVLLGHIHQGNSVVSGSDILNQPKSPTANILGPSLWKIQVQLFAGVDNFADAFSDSGGTLGETFEVFTSPDGMSHSVVRPIVEQYDPVTFATTLILSDVTPLRSHASDYSRRPLENGWIMTLGANVFEIAAIDEAPYISDVGNDVGGAHSFFPTKGDAHDNKFVMDFGLNAAFHAQNSSSEFTRGRFTGFGNQIYVPGGTRSPNGAYSDTDLHRPFTTILEGLEPFEVGHLTISDHVTVGLHEVYSKSGARTARIRHDGTIGDGSLTFADTNTMNNPDLPAHDGDIPFSSTESTYDNSHVMHNLRDLPKEIRQNSILGALEALLQGSRDFTGTAGTWSYGAYSNGVFYGGEVLSKNDVNALGPPLKAYPLIDAGVWTGNNFDISIGEAYFNEFGAKNYAAPASLDLAANAGFDVLVYWDIASGSWDTDQLPATSDSMGSQTAFTSLDRIPVAVVTVGALGIEQIVDIRQRICSSDQRDEIYVGRMAEDVFTNNEHQELNIDDAWCFRQGAMHFPTIGHAVKAIEKWNRHFRTGRSWTIKVVGPTNEVATPHRGIEYPIKMPVDSIKIEGVGARLGPANSMDSDGVSRPIITCWGYNGLFDLNSCSNLTFSNLSVRFEPIVDPATGAVWMDNHTDDLPVVNVFTNSLSPLMAQDITDIGGAAMHGRRAGGFYTVRGSEPLQSDITIEGVHASGPHHCFFHHGQTNGLDALGAPALHMSEHTDVPFDNLTIKDCVNKDGLMGFVILCPSNAESLRLLTCWTDPQPYYWRNVRIINCNSVGETFEPDTKLVSELSESLVFDGIHLAACKEVVIRDCFISSHVKGITLGKGNGSHFCTGLIENNHLISICGDAISVYSESDDSAIRVTGNRISDFGSQFATPSVLTPQPVSANPELRDNRYAAIFLTGNHVTVDNNYISCTRGNPTHVAPTTQAIFIGTNLFSSYYTGINISNNTFTSDQNGARFLYSFMELLDNLTVRGNIHRSTLEQPWWEGSHIHPIFDWFTSNMSVYSETNVDHFAIDLHFITDSSIEGNSFEGHVSIVNADNSSISSNQMVYPNTIVSIAGGNNVNFSENNLDNGTLVFHGSGITVSTNNFCKADNDEVYLDVIGQADAIGVPRIFPGVYVRLEDTSSAEHPYAVISDNTLASTPETLRYDGVLNAILTNRNLKSTINITQLDPTVLSRATVTGNVFTFNGGIYVEAGTQTIITGNEVDTRFTPGGTLPDDSLTVVNIMDPQANQSNYSNSLADGRRRSNVNIANNYLRGNVRINGCYQEFRDWNELTDGFVSGLRPDDGSGVWPRNGAAWNSYADGGDPNRVIGAPAGSNNAEYRHNKISNVSLLGNTIAGNIEMIAVQDSNVVDNRMSGAALSSLNFETFSNYPSTKDLFTRGQIALISCKRIQISNCKFADLFIMRSSIVQCSDSIIGHTSQMVDSFGYYHHLSVGTYAPSSQGRVFAAYSHNITIDTCQLSDATMDKEPLRDRSVAGDNENHPQYMNDFDAAVYSSTFYANNNGIPNSAEINHRNEYFKDIPNVGAISTHAMTVSNCRVAMGVFSACDDLKLTNNRFYYGGVDPKAAYCLVINESSMRPCLQNNHFTSSVSIGDIPEYEAREGKDGTREWTSYVERIVRMPVHAQVTGNRFDSAVGSSFSEWVDEFGNPAGQRYGCGDLVIHNYGGSLISNNHMMKSPYGYMMHAGDPGNLSQREPYASYTAAQRSMVEDARKDAYNRIGGSIRLDDGGFYNPIYYTKAFVYGVIVATSETLGDEAAEAYHRVLIGTGRTNVDDFANWDRSWADAPEPWRGKKLYAVSSNVYNIPSTAGSLLNDISAAHPDNGGFDDVLDYYPWGGTWVYNWFATSEMIFRNAEVDIHEDGGSVIRAAHHFPKILGSFVIGNFCKDVVMDNSVRQSSWAYGRHCDIRVDHYGQPHLPAQAYETPLNPMHANNHSQFNMLRSKKEHIDLAMFGNFGSYVIRSNYSLDKAYGPERHASDRYAAFAEGEVFRKNVSSDGNTADFEYVRLSQPSVPDGNYLFDGGSRQEGEPCDPFLEVVVQGDIGDSGAASSETSCVLGGTMIETERGQIPAEDIVIGDRVRSYDFAAEAFDYFDVLWVKEPIQQDRWVLLTTESGYELRCSDSHPLYTLDSDDNELPVLEAKVGDLVFVVDNDELIEDKIESIEVIDDSVTVYNFEVDTVRSYISDGILSHNKVTAGGGGGGVVFDPPDIVIVDPEDTESETDYTETDVTYAPSAISDV